MMDCDSTSLSRAAEWLQSTAHVVVFSGAGASAESGIPTFRDDAGFWREFPPEQFATWAGLVATAAVRPRRLAEFVHAVLQPIAAAQPNAGHRAIAKLEMHAPVTVVTQNIDGLHQQAGSTTVHEVHGSLFEVVSRKGKPVARLSRGQMLEMAESLMRAKESRFALPRVLHAMRPLFGVGPRGIHRPNVVLFGGAMAEPDWTLALEAVEKCDCLIQVGTSGTIWPAAMLPDTAKESGARVITIDPTTGDGDLWLRGTAATALPALVEAAFGDAEDKPGA